MSDTPINPVPHFVWFLNSTGRPRPQKWVELYYGEHDWMKSLVVAAWPISEAESAMTLDELAARYPLDSFGGGRK